MLMITKKIMPLLMLALIWQGTSLYGMLASLARQQFTRRQVLKNFTKRHYCDNSLKRPEYLKNRSFYEKRLNNYKEKTYTFHGKLRDSKKTYEVSGDVTIKIFSKRSERPNNSEEMKGKANRDDALELFGAIAGFSLLVTLDFIRHLVT